LRECGQSGTINAGSKVKREADEKCNTLILSHLFRKRNRWEERVYTDMEMWRNIRRKVFVDGENKRQLRAKPGRYFLQELAGESIPENPLKMPLLLVRRSLKGEAGCPRKLTLSNTS
jgi:hypothetical protein